jgi:glucokinase
MYLGIEIGGTKLQLGVGAGDGVLKGLWRGSVNTAAGPDGIRRQITAAVPELLSQAGVDRAQVKGVGIGFGGPVDDLSQTVIKSHQIQGWDDFALGSWVTQMLGWPAVLGNDADVAGLAEALFGAGKGLSPVFYITIGSGIGGGFILNGEIYRGCGRGAAEIGHMRIAVETPSGTHHMPLEQLASGWAIQQRVRAELNRDAGVSSVLQHFPGGAEAITAQTVAQAAEKGDNLAWAVLNRAWAGLAEAICQVIVLLCPRRIVIGGGVAQMGEDILFEPLRDAVALRIFRPFIGLTDIVPAKLGEEVVVHGALVLARRRLGGGERGD